MKGFKFFGGLIIGALAGAAYAQSWTGAYDAGLSALKAKSWAEARKSFQQAIAYRPEDISSPTFLPGPVSQRKTWRNGSAYSPNFLAAYANFKLALEASDAKVKNDLFSATESEFRVLLDKGQLAKPTYYFLSQVYKTLGKSDQLSAMATKYGSQLDWKVDTEALNQEEVAAIVSAFTPVKAPEVKTPETKSPETKAPETKPAPVDPKKPEPEKPAPAEEKKPETATQSGPVTMGANRRKPANKDEGKKPQSDQMIPAEALANNPYPASVKGPVAVSPNKYALIIGNSDAKSEDLKLSYAVEDAERVKGALVDHAGYAADHIEMLANPTAKQLLDTATALAEKVPDGGTVFLFYAGGGANIGAKDYLAASDTDVALTPATMVAKADIYQLFMQKGARIFAFYEVNRTMRDGRYFGMEVPQFGSISQAQATTPGEKVTAKYKTGKLLGVYADALAMVISDFHNNRIPVSEFGWQVFYKVRRGDTGLSGGGSKQTPTLPVLSNLASDARF